MFVFVLLVDSMVNFSVSVLLLVGSFEKTPITSFRSSTARRKSRTPRNKCAAETRNDVAVVVDLLFAVSVVFFPYKVTADVGW